MVKLCQKHSDDTLGILGRQVLKIILKTPGILSAKVLGRIEGGICHFWTMTEWPDIESIKLFAGDDFEKARYYPDDKNFLLEFEEKVIHCETFYD